LRSNSQSPTGLLMMPGGATYQSAGGTLNGAVAPHASMRPAGFVPLFAHDPDRLDPWPRRLDAVGTRGLSGLYASPEAALGGDSASPSQARTEFGIGPDFPMYRGACSSL